MQSRVTRVLTALLVAASAHAMAQPAAPWRATVAPPRPGLPGVSIEVGYPGPYVPAFNSPLIIHATAGRTGFDGYIGFHFDVDGKSTLDQPVIARAVIRPHETWTFHTIAILHAPYGRDQSFARALIVEWRNRSIEPIDSANAGTPPWIVGASNRVPLRATTAPALPNFSQWYAGYSSIVIPLTMWLDLRQDVREAIFGSAIEVVFVGFARADQRIDPSTKALLPVEFSAGSSSFAIPWPYGGTTATAPVSWTAKRGAGFTGSATRPYIARTLAASWVADERALDRPLPSVVHLRSRPRTILFEPVMSDARVWIWISIALLTAVVAWLLVRNNRLVAGAALAIAFAATTAMTRQSVRRTAETRDFTKTVWLAPGIGAEYHLLFDRGPSPLAASPVDRFSVTGGDWVPKKAEVRTSDTSPSMGTIESWGDWGFDVRWKMKRTLRQGSADRVVQFAGNDLHGMVLVATDLANDEANYVIQAEPVKLADGRQKVTFALAARRRDRTARISLTAAMAGAPMKVTWATGSTDLPLHVMGGGYSGCDIPPDVLRAIDDSGGVFEAIATPGYTVVRPFYNIELQVQEKS